MKWGMWIKKNWLGLLALAVSLCVLYIAVSGTPSWLLRSPTVIEPRQEQDVFTIVVENRGTTTDNSVSVRADFSAPIRSVQVPVNVHLVQGGEGTKSVLFFMDKIVPTQREEILITTADNETDVRASITATSATGHTIVSWKNRR